MCDQKYYCKKLNNNKLKNHNHAINQIFNFRPNKNRNFICQQIFMQ